MATGSEINEYINEIWYQFDHILKRCRQDSQVLVSHGVKETCEKSLRRLGQLLAFLGGAGELVNDALELIQNVGDLFDRLSDRRNQASQFNDFTKGFKLIENQAEELMTRGHRVGVDGPLVGLEKDVQLVTSQLLQNEVDRGLVSIVGAKGVGKTVLAREVYNNSDIVGQFQMRAWVRVPREFESNSVQLDIAMQVLPFEELKTVYSPTTMISCLRDILRKRRYLIVLDDIETLVAWKSLEKSLPDTSNCSRILITTRNRDLIDLIDHGPSRRVFEKWQLSEEYSWKLFKVRVGSRVSTAQQEFWRVAVSKCMGLPSAIYAVADEAIQSAVPQQIQHDQSAVPQQIQHDQSAVQQQDPINFADALPPYLQQWLVYLGFFPEEYQVPARRLIAYWVSGGQMQQNTEPESQELFAEKHLRDFGRANIIQVVKRRTNGNVKRCRISHILRHNWLSRAKNASSCTLNSNSAISTSSSPGMMSSSPGMMLQLNDRWLSKAKNAISRTLNSNAAISTSSSPGMMLQLIDRFDEEDDFFSHIHGNRIISKSSLKRIYQNLSCFISLDYREGPSPGNEVGNFFRECIAAGCFKVLQFVDLERVFQPNLPDSIGTLAKLRYLSLRWTYLETLPSSIGNLLELQTLDLKYTNISSLPSFLWKMGQLRRLYLNGNFRSTLESPASTSIVTEIQTLWGAYLNEETLIKNALDRLVNIRKLGLTCSLGPSKLKELAEWITELDELESLRLRLIDHEAVQASDIYLNSLSGLKKLSIIYLFGRLQNQVIVEDFPESLTEITLSFSELSEDPMPNLEKLPNLTTLKLLAGSYSGQSMHCSLRGFPLLQVLKLWCLQSLEEWIVETGAMKILRELEIRSCNELRVIPDGFEHLINCHELKITDMPDTFKARIIENTGEDWYKIKHMSVIQHDIVDGVNGAN